MAKSSLTNVFSHWSKLFEDFNTSSLEYYKSLEAALARRQIPDAKISRVDYQESGVLTAQREYLRVSRGLLRIDVCAAPFGTGFFFSTWSVFCQPRFGWFFGTLLLVFELWVMYAVFGALQDLAQEIARDAWQLAALLNSEPVRLIGALLAGFLAFLVLCVLARAGLPGVEYALLAIPLVSGFYIRYFRPDTYFEVDTMQMFRSGVDAAVQETIDALITAQGLRVLSEDERKPIMRDFFGR